MNSFPRRRFDYVVANPPYVSYNESSKQGMPVFEQLKNGKVKLTIYMALTYTVSLIILKDTGQTLIFTRSLSL